MNPKLFLDWHWQQAVFFIAQKSAAAIQSVPGTIRGENPPHPFTVTPDQVSPGFDPRRELIPCPYKIPEETIRQILDPNFKLMPFRLCPAERVPLTPHGHQIRRYYGVSFGQMNQIGPSVDLLTPTQKEENCPCTFLLK